MLLELLSIIAPVFAACAVGYVWARMERPFDTAMVTALISFVGAPCLVFHVVANVKVEGDAFATVAGASLAAIASFLALGYAGLRLLRLPVRPLLPSLTFPNTGNMGLPLAYLAFGEPGLAFGTAVFAAVSIVHFILGPAIVSGSLSPGRLLRIPLIYGVMAGLPFMIQGTPPPKWLNASTELLGGMTVPLMLITLGISLARIKAANLKWGAGLGLARLAMGLAVGVGLSWAFGLEGVARAVLIIDCAMPVAVFNFLFAQQYGGRPDEVAGAVVVSTAISFATLPALLWSVMP